MNIEVLLYKPSLVLNKWISNDLLEIVNRNSNTYFSKIIKTPITSKKQKNVIPLEQNNTPQKQLEKPPPPNKKIKINKKILDKQKYIKLLEQQNKLKNKKIAMKFFS
jgi:hypothetical protein